MLKSLVPIISFWSLRLHSVANSIQFHFLVIKMKDVPADTAATWNRSEYERARE